MECPCKLAKLAIAAAQKPTEAKVRCGANSVRFCSHPRVTRERYRDELLVRARAVVVAQRHVVQAQVAEWNGQKMIP